MRKAKPNAKERNLPVRVHERFRKVLETELPPREEFYSKLSGKGIIEKEYDHAQYVWKKFGCCNLGDYHELYVQTDMCCCSCSKTLHGKVRSRPAALLHSSRSQLGRYVEKDRRQAGALDRHGHALFHRKRHAGWHLDGKQVIRKSQQPKGVSL